MVDTSKKSNIKCEHCHYWNRYKCHNEDSPKWNKKVNYWNRCKEFEWNERIKQEVKMKNFAIAELEKVKGRIQAIFLKSGSIIKIIDREISELKGENNE